MALQQLCLATNSKEKSITDCNNIVRKLVEDIGLLCNQDDCRRHYSQDGLHIFLRKPAQYANQRSLSCKQSIS